MRKNENLARAKKAKNDEFYTQWHDIENEMNAYYEYNHDVFRGKTILLPCDDPEWSEFTRYFGENFDFFGLKKLISTSYAKSSGNMQLTMCEMESPYYDKELHDTHGRLYVLERTPDSPEHIHLDDVKFQGYLKGDGDFRSEEVTRLRDEADIIITNPPFSLFREFLHWIVEADKQFIIIGNMNAITYKEVFPLLKENKMWLGYKPLSGGMNMIVPKDVFKDMKVSKYTVNSDGQIIVNVMGVCWYSNLDHGKRHEPLMLAPACDNLRYNKKFRKVLIEKYHQNPEHCHYEKYDNYDAIEVPYVQVIPNDYYEGYYVPLNIIQSWDSKRYEVVPPDFHLDNPKPLPQKDGTGKFYVLIPQTYEPKPSQGLVLSLNHTREEMEQALSVMGVTEDQASYCSGVMGVPISFLDKYNPDQFDIVAFRKGKDGKDLVLTREREREFNRTFAFLCNENTRANEQSKGHQSERSVNVCPHHHPTQEPIDIVHPLTTNLNNGLINDCTIHGKKTYIRMLIRAKSE